MATFTPQTVVLITGAARGLGAALARAFHAAGASVVLNYHSSAALATALAAELGPRALPLQADVRSRPAVAALFAAAEAHFAAPIAVVVNNALAPYVFDASARTPLDAIEYPALAAQLDVALQGTLHTTQAALPGFAKRGGGRIVNIGTNLTHRPLIPYQDYIAAKGALEAFTRSAAAELGPRGVTVNMVAGGLLRGTDASAAVPEEAYAMVAGMTPMGRVAEPADLAGAVMFLASEGAAMVTGQRICVDGGLAMT